LQTIDFFADVARSLALPSTAGGIYGVLFLSTRALHMNEIKTALNISLGATSQGLKLLRTMGIIQMTYESRDRRDYYVPELDIRQIIGSLLRNLSY
jgi:DNA-binding transcriptional regulator GbsR (MarR family)